MSKPRIANLLPMGNWGGIERVLIDFLLSSHPDSIEHILITTSSNPELIKLVEDANLPWFQPEGKFKYDPTKLFSICKFISNNNIKLIHSRNSHANAWVYLISLLLKNPPIIVTGEHGSIWNTRIPIRWLDHISQLKARLVITNSRASSTMLQLKYHIPKRKIRIAYNGVKVSNLYSREESRTILGLQSNQFVIGSVGRLDTPKDYWSFIDTAFELTKMRKDVLFVIIGGGPQDNFLREMIIRKGLSDKFIITGYRTDARELIPAFDLFVSTSVHESFGNNLLEAALHQKAVIAPAVDGIPEVVIDNETGILLLPTDPFRYIPIKGTSLPTHEVIIGGRIQKPKSLNPVILADTIDRLLDDPEKRSKMGAKASERANQLFSISNYATTVDNIYCELLGLL